MIRIAIYHWLPIADNMMPEIEASLKAMPSDSITDLMVDHDAITYKVLFTLSGEGRGIGCFPVRGKINQRGFSQHILNLAPIAGMPLGAMLNEIVPALQSFLAEHLASIVPMGVRNKCAVLREGIVSFQQFHATLFDQRIENSAIAFLREYHLVAIMLDEQQAEAIQAGFTIPNLKLEVPAGAATTRAIANPEGTSILFYSAEYHPDEISVLDSVIFKFCSLATFVRFLARVIVILKQTRDHVVPLRRQLVIALQRNTEEHFVLLTQMKKYLTYVNVKLPVVQKVLNHLNAARRSDLFAAKVATFDEPAKVYSYPAIRAIDVPRLQAHYLIPKIEEDSQRLQSLYDEDLREIQVISNELSQVLEGSLMSENVQISTRGLDAWQASLELDRGGKNRSNALKILSIVLSANLGGMIADTFSFHGEIKLLVAAVATGMAWTFTEFFIKQRASYFRLVMPINATVPRESLDNLADKHPLKRTESNGSRRIRTWADRFVVGRGNGEEYSRRKENGHYNGNGKGRSREFDVTIDYEKRGFIHSVTLETEYYRDSFNQRSLVEQMVERMAQAGCLQYYEEQETSLLAAILTHLDIYIDRDLIALNKILTLPSAELGQILGYGLRGQLDSSLSKEDRRFVEDIVKRRNRYMKWLIDVQEDPKESKLLTLLGRYNVQHKLDVIRTAEDNYVGPAFSNR